MQFDGEGNPGVGGPPHAPRLSTVTLAFLEACCHAAPEDMQWRVYDVCAVMRRQQELRNLEKQARPRKSSHHFYEESDDVGDGASSYGNSGASGAFSGDGGEERRRGSGSEDEQLDLESSDEEEPVFTRFDVESSDEDDAPVNRFAR